MVPSSLLRKCLAVLLLSVCAPATAGGFGDDSGSSTFEMQIGGFVAVAPKYDGSDEYEVIGFPIIAPASGYGIGDDGFVQFRGPDDLRFRLINWNGFEAGPLAGWRFEREEDDGDRLRGLGDVDGGIVVGGYAAYRFGAFMPFVSYHHEVSGDDDTGALIRFGAEAKTNLTAGWSVTGIVGASYADDDYMDAYFTVTPLQAANSRAGLPAYEADAGIKDVYVGLTSDVPLTDVWTLKLSGRYARLVGDAADSPIVENENQFYGGLGLTYRFGFQR